MWLIGTGCADITANKDGVGMMGYGRYWNIVKSVSTPLLARAIVVKDPDSGRKMAFVNCEIALITISVKRGVVKRLKRFHTDLGYHFDNVMITAQHTHSGPGGYSHYAFYNLSIPGFVVEVYQEIVNGIVRAILEAEKSLRPAIIREHSGLFPEDAEVAFNRSLDAYNLNKDVKKIPKNKTQLAVDRKMTLWRIEDQTTGIPFACLNWFGTHATSISNDNNAIDADNKGYAARFFEERMKAETNNDDFVAIFAQERAGDVSPNWIWDKKKKWTRGKFENDFESAAYNGKLQYEQALTIFKEAADKSPLAATLDYRLDYYNFAATEVDPDFADGQTGKRTGPACLGVAFFEGTVEGPGMDPLVGKAARVLCDIIKQNELKKAEKMPAKEGDRIREKYIIQGKKHILVETGERKVLGTHNVAGLPLPGWADRSLTAFKEYYKSGALDIKPWTPQILPLQIILVGTTALVGIPAEISTVAGRRLEAQLLQELTPRNISRVVLCPYANAYAGYIVTYEEYQLQKYEGGHTVFGEYTLGAFQTRFRQLAQKMVEKPFDTNYVFETDPVEFSDEELAKRPYVEKFDFRKFRKQINPDGK